MNIVKKAKQTKRIVKTKKEPKDVVKLSVAWAKDEISISQIANVLGYKRNEYALIYPKLARSLKQYLQSK